MPPAPSYQQVREPVVTKQSPQRAAALDAPTESPKAKRSSSKSRPQRGLGCSSNTSTPKLPDSTSTKKPSCSMESTPGDQAKSPKARSSCKCGHSPLLPQGQPDANEKIFTQRTLAQLTPPFPSAPACLMPSAAQWVPSVT